jgi:hypothetical protein
MPDQNKRQRDMPGQTEFRKQGNSGQAGQSGQSGYEGQKRTADSQPNRGSESQNQGNRGDGQQFDRNR